MFRVNHIGDAVILQEPSRYVRISTGGYFLYQHKYTHKPQYEFKCVHFTLRFYTNFIDGSYMFYLMG